METDMETGDVTANEVGINDGCYKVKALEVDYDIDSMSITDEVKLKWGVRADVETGIGFYGGHSDVENTWLLDINNYIQDRGDLTSSDSLAECKINVQLNWSSNQAFQLLGTQAHHSDFAHHGSIAKLAVFYKKVGECFTDLHFPIEDTVTDTITLDPGADGDTYVALQTLQTPSTMPTYCNDLIEWEIKHKDNVWDLEMEDDPKYTDRNVRFDGYNEGDEILISGSPTQLMIKKIHADFTPGTYQLEIKAKLVD